MPLIIDTRLPCTKELLAEGLHVIDKNNSYISSYENISILIVNLMPTKYETEKQLLRILGCLPYNLRVEFLYVESHKQKNIYPDYLQLCYKTIREISNKSFHGMIVTGAPLEHLDFEQVDYWSELMKIMNYANENVKSTIYICWAAQAALYYNYGIKKSLLDKKVFGVLKHTISNKAHPLFKSFDDEFYAPHSRYSEIRKEALLEVEFLNILSETEDSSIYIAASKTGHQFFITGHSEYDELTLKNEYERDISKGINIGIPSNYFRDNDILSQPIVRWRAHSNLLFSNWISEFVLDNY